MKKTYQNHRSCRKGQLNAGDKTSTTCPPSLNKSVKQALLNEIKNFDPKIARKEAEISARGGPSLNAYNRWLDQNGGQEPTEANPDVLSEGEGIKFIPRKKDKQSVRLLTEFRQYLPTRQLQVWNLIMKHNLSYQEVADLLNLKVSTVQCYVERAKLKFAQFVEDHK